MYGFFYQYTALAALNYISVYLAAIVYALVVSKFMVANRVAPAPAPA